MSDKLCIDLCSGLGGFSQAFVDAGWEVIRVDFNPNFKPTICADITTLKAATLAKATKKGVFSQYKLVVVVASPPCEKFSLAAIGKNGVHNWPPKTGLREALSIVGACLDLIGQIHPHGWLLENPKARLRWFLGRPSITVSYLDYGGSRYKETDLWGDIGLPLLEAKVARKIPKKERAKALGLDYLKLSHDEQNLVRHSLWSKETGSAAERAKIPLGLSQAILEAVESQP